MYLESIRVEGEELKSLMKERKDLIQVSLEWVIIVYRTGI
jgi:hypothetical protein